MAAAASSMQNVQNQPGYQGPSLNGMERIMDPENLITNNTYVIALRLGFGDEIQPILGIKVKYLERVVEEGEYMYKFEVLEAVPGHPVGRKLTIKIPDNDEIVYGYKSAPVAAAMGGGYRRRRRSRKSTRRHRRGHYRSRGRKSTRRHQ